MLFCYLVPGAVPWVYLRSRGPNSLEIEWSPIPENNTHGVLLGYIVQFRKYNYYENFTIVNVDASTQGLSIIALREATRYEIKVAGRTSVGVGSFSNMYEYTGL